METDTEMTAGAEAAMLLTRGNEPRDKSQEVEVAEQKNWKDRMPLLERDLFIWGQYLISTKTELLRTIK